MRLPNLTAIFIAACLVAPVTQAAPGPYAAGNQQRNQQQHQHNHHNQHSRPYDQQRWDQQRYPRREIRRQQSPYDSPQYRPPRYGEPVDHHQIYRERYQRQLGSPPDRNELQQQIRRNRYRLDRGPIPPPNVRFIPGQLLPRGYSQLLPSAQVRNLPHYPGYEWRSAGYDLLLVTQADGLIYSVINNVLK